MTILYTLICLLIFGILCAGAYYAARYHIRIQHDNRELAQYKVDADAMIIELQSDIEQLKATIQQDRQTAATTQTSGWDNFEVRR